MRVKYHLSTVGGFALAMVIALVGGTGAASVVNTFPVESTVSATPPPAQPGGVEKG
ncbi:hypothetical protein [Corynebacterium phocae]|uniref:hypothetical protein n=1 Tax=Corynebacterium phocae TaxID=161895 RepID=UPI0012ED7ACB|nr:hypothetical protein [Corynebacterium phocae]